MTKQSEDEENGTCSLSTPEGDYRVAPNDPRWIANSANVRPGFAIKLSAMMRSLNSQGVRPTITTAYRSPAKQAELRARAAAGEAGITTPARVSNHSNGMAADFGSAGGTAAYRRAGAASGLTWGGNFRTPDPVHYQGVPAGTRPSAADVDACGAN